MVKGKIFEKKTSKFTWGFVLIFFFLSFHFSNAQLREWSFLVNRQEVEPIRYSINPNNPVIKFSKHGRRWENQLGLKTGLISKKTLKATHALVLHALIELYDFHPGPYLSWQLWRGLLGLEYKYLVNIKGKSKLLTSFSIGYFHESDHVTDFLNYRLKFLKTSSIDFYSRAYEYISISSELKKSLNNSNFFIRCYCRNEIIHNKSH